jgi:hypothetical protein
MRLYWYFIRFVDNYSEIMKLCYDNVMNVLHIPVDRLP